VLSALPPPDDRVSLSAPRTQTTRGLPPFGGEALIGTLDFFTPIVDDPYLYGAIAAANSLSDVYAMGGEPLFALAIAAFPEDEKILPYLADVMAGAAAKAKEAGICIMGPHGQGQGAEVRPLGDRPGPPRPDVAQPGREGRRRHRPDEALGTGIATSAIKWGICPKETEEAVTGSMARLNANASKAGRQVGISTATT